MMMDSGGHREGKRGRGPFKRARRGDRSHHQKQRKEEDEDGAEPVEMTPTLLVFKNYQKELDLKHDKYERLVKVSRDITIESKRIIFLLHRIDGDAEKVLEEAEARLKSVQDDLISKIAHELKGEDLHQFLRAFSPGLQEYIEAVSFYLFIKEERLVSLEEVASRLTFREKKKEQGQTSGKEESTNEGENKPELTTSETADNPASPLATDTSASTANSTESISESDQMVQIALKLPPLEYMLGLADFTGELMRLCINIIGSGDLERPFQLVSFMRGVNRGFQMLGNVAGREMVRKATVMRQSLKKMEDACYVIRVRGSEIPKHMLKDAAFRSDFAAPPSNRDDEYGQDMTD